MSPASIANLKRTLSAFLALVAKLQVVGEDPEFRHLFLGYHGPSWEPEFSEALDCLREARALAASSGSAEGEIPGAAISPGAGG